MLRLLHPFMPFITEEIWQRLPLQRASDSIMIAPYPEPDSRLADWAAETEMAPVVAAIEGLRTLRGESSLPPSARLVAHVQSPNAGLRSTLERCRGYLMTLAGLSEVHVEPPGRKPPQSAAFVSGEMEIYVPLAGLIDMDAERERLNKEISRAEQELASVQRKLENPNFVAKAPPDVVEKDRARVEELNARKAKLQEHLSRIAPEASMSEETTPEAVESTLPNPETAQVKVAPPTAPAEGGVDLSQELKGELEASADIVNPQITDALNKLREGTKEGLSPKDHHDLGVAYMSMGLVDDAMREFDKAKEGGDERPAPEPPAKVAPARRAEGKKGGASKATAKKAPAKKAPAKKAPAKKAPAKRAPAKRAPAKRAPAKKAPVKKAPVKKAPVKKAPVKKAAKKAAGKAAGRSARAAARPVKKAAAKKAGKPARKTTAKARR
jgi:valyl-tRNA synthetase